VKTTRSQKKRATTEYLEKRSGVRNGDNRIQVQLEAAAQDRTGWRKVVYVAYAPSQVYRRRIWPVEVMLLITKEVVDGFS